MKTLRVICAVVCCAVPAWAATNELVRVKLTDGAQIEGIILEERPQEIVVQVSMAGGTILKTDVIPRTNVVDVAPLSAEELASRAEAAAYDQTLRYTLNPTASYPSEYYAEVIANVFRAFISKYPHSPHAGEVAERLGAWQAEQQRVDAGQVKYKGQWLTAEEAGARMEREEGQRRLAEAKTYVARGQYKQAITVMRLLPGAESRQFVADTYRRWIADLETQQQRLTPELEKNRQRLTQAQTAVDQFASKTNRIPSLATSSDSKPWVGPSQEETLARNKANSDLQNATASVNQLQARFAAVERDLTQARSDARRYGIAPAEPVPTASNAAPTGKDLVQDVQAGRIDRGESKNPELLGQIADFFRAYWMPTALIALVAIWYFSRRMSR